MIAGTGVDIAEVPRIQPSIERFGERFLRRVFTGGEITYSDSKRQKPEGYAARSSAKEAALKAIGTGLHHGIAWREVEVTRVPGGPPTIALYGVAAGFAAQLGMQRARLDVSEPRE